MSQDPCGTSRDCVWRVGRKLGISPLAVCIGVDSEGDPCGARAMINLSSGDEDLSSPQPFCKLHLGIIVTAVLNLKGKLPDNPPKYEPRAADLRAPGGFVYFVRRGDLVKIGYSTDIRTRLRNLELMGGSEFDEIVVSVGTRAQETKYHRQFAALRTTGEWFRCEPPIVAEMDRLRPLDPMRWRASA